MSPKSCARWASFSTRARASISPAGQRQTVTGLVVNEKPAVPSDYLRSLRQELYFCQKFGVSDHMAHLGIKESEAHYLARLLGRVNYVLQITPGKKEGRRPVPGCWSNCLP